MTGRAEQAAAWMYRGLWGVLVDLFKVPQEPPSLPAQGDDKIDSFKPAKGYLRYMKMWFWIVFVITDVIFMIGYIAAAIALSVAGLWWVALALLPFALFIIL